MENYRGEFSGILHGKQVGRVQWNPKALKTIWESLVESYTRNMWGEFSGILMHGKLSRRVSGILHGKQVGRVQWNPNAWKTIEESLVESYMGNMWGEFSGILTHGKPSGDNLVESYRIENKKWKL